MSSSSKLIAGTAALAVVAAAGAAFAAVKLSESTGSSSPMVTAPYGHSIAGAGLGGGRLGGRGFGGGLGPGPGTHFRSGFEGARFFGGVSSAVSGYLRISAATVRSDLQKGESLAQIAKAQGKTADGLIGVMLADQERRIEAAVSRGVLTQTQAGQLDANLQRQIADLVNGVHPSSGPQAPAATA
jgi:hypothetical protein